MIPEIVYPHTPFPLPQSLILLARVGSEAHGLFVPSGSHDGIDDHDLMGVCVPPVEYYLGTRQWDNANAINGPWDVVLFEVRKFVNLLVKQNPNVLGFLWCEEEDVLSKSVEGMVLRENRDIFRSEEAKPRFIGYAYGQLERMTAFDRPMMEKIDTLERMLTDHGIDPLHVIASPPIQVPPHLSGAAQEYRDKRKRYHKAYMGSKRWASVRELGYEYLTTGQLHVRRTWDREMLLEIKRGEWDLPRIKEHAALWFKKVEGAKSVLPVGVDMDQVNSLLLYIVGNRLNLKGGLA
jgi:hypothetical protein